MKAKVANKESEIRFQELELEECQKKMENTIEFSRKKAKMEAELAEEFFLQKMKTIDQQTELATKKEERQLEAWQASDATVLRFLKNLGELGVGISTFLCTPGGKKATAGILERAPSLAVAPK